MASCTGWGESFQCNATIVQQRANIAMKYTIIVANQARTMVDFLALQYEHFYRIELYLGSIFITHFTPTNKWAEDNMATMPLV